MSQRQMSNLDREELLKEIRRLEKALKESEQIREEFVNASYDGYWDWKIQEEYEYMSPRFWEILGFDPTTKKHHPSEWQQLIFQEDLEIALDNFDKHIKTRGDHPFMQNVRYRHRDGTTVTVICRGKVIEWDEDGKPLRMIGTHTDITALTKLENQLKLTLGLVPKDNIQSLVLKKIKNITEIGGKKRSPFQEILNTIALQIRLVVGANISVISYSPTGRLQGFQNAVSLSDKFTGQNTRDTIQILVDDIIQHFDEEEAQLLPDEFISTAIGSSTDSREYVKFNGLLCVPIKLQDGEIIGYFHCYDKVEGKFTLDDQDLLYDLSGYISFIFETNLMHEKLEQKSIQLEKSNKELQQFAYIASHDLQAPIRHISTHVDLLTSTLPGELSEDQNKSVQFILDGTKKMISLINDLLTLSRIGREQLAIKHFQVRDVIDSIEVIYHDKINESGAKIQVENEKVYADFILMEQIFQNLFDNSLKFTRENTTPKISIEVTQRNGNQLLIYRDNGIGFDSKHAEQVFLMFKRLYRDDCYPGTGIGLTICKKCVELLDGKIWVESEPGVGTTFFIQLPK